MKLNFYASSFTENSREARSDDDWDRGDTHTTWDISNIAVLTDDTKSPDRYMDNYSYHEYLPCDNVKVGDTLYVVAGIWSTGDSFGHDNNARLDFMYYSKDKWIASFAQFLLEHDICDLPEHTLYVPWNGYFDGLGYIDIIKVEVV